MKVSTTVVDCKIYCRSNVYVLMSKFALMFYVGKEIILFYPILFHRGIRWNLVTVFFKTADRYDCLTVQYYQLYSTNLIGRLNQMSNIIIWVDRNWHYIRHMKNSTFELGPSPYEHGKLPFSTVFIHDYTAAINQACFGIDVKDSKLKTTWLNIKAV